MNKTVTANISGIVFHIESEAYEKLHKYLNTIRNYFRDSDGKDEIMADIESRIAELFRELLTNGKEVVTIAEVNRVVEIMGEPEQYMDESSSENFNYQESHSEGSSQTFRSKKLYRDPDDKILGGVCSGLGHFFGVDRIWIRALFVIAVIAGFGFGIIIYLILWGIIPKAMSTSKKLEMKGEPINVENIGNSIKDEFASFKKKVNPNSNNYSQKASDSVGKFFEIVGRILTFILKFIVKAIGVFLVLGGAIGLITVITIAIGAPQDLQINSSNWGGYWSQEFAEIFFGNGGSYTIGFIGALLVSIIPLLAILYGGVKILFKIPSSNKAFGITGIALFIVGVIMVSYTATSTAAQYSSKQNITDYVTLDSLTSDTLILRSMEEHYSRSYNSRNEIFIENDFIFTDNMSVTVVKSMDKQYGLRLNKSSRGSNRKVAGALANNIDFTYEINDNELSISPYIDFPLVDKFRNQQVEISIELPVGKSIYLEESSTDIIYDIKNITNTYDGKMIGHTWKMTEKGLQCTDCSWIEFEDVVEEIIEEIIEK